MEAKNSTREELLLAFITTR